MKSGKLFSVLVVFMLLAKVLTAAPVALVGNEEGHAILVLHRGNCYAVMPDHVASADRMGLVAALPQTSGVAHVFHRIPEMDLALAYVEGDMTRRCEQRWDKLGQSLDRVFSGSSTGGLTRLQFNGQFVDRARATIIDVDENNFVIATSSEWADAEIMSGVSGALFLVGDVPAGIALTSLDTTKARFLRMDRVYSALNSVLMGAVEDHPSNQSIAPTQSGLGYRITGQVRLKDGQQAALDNALQAEWTGAPIEIVFTLSNDLPVPVKKITLQSVQDGNFTHPQRVQLELDVGSPDRPFWREIFAPDATPLGILEVPTGNTVARRVRLRVLSVWNPDRPMKIDQVLFE